MYETDPKDRHMPIWDYYNAVWFCLFCDWSVNGSHPGADQLAYNHYLNGRYVN